MLYSITYITANYLHVIMVDNYLTIIITGQTNRTFGTLESDYTFSVSDWFSSFG